MTHSHPTGGSACPLCGRDNGCAVQAGRDPAGCWCMNARFPAGLLERVPPEKRRKSCICQDCLDRYQAEQALSPGRE